MTAQPFGRNGISDFRLLRALSAGFLRKRDEENQG
jgi:hypothetical protein